MKKIMSLILVLTLLLLFTPTQSMAADLGIEWQYLGQIASASSGSVFLYYATQIIPWAMLGVSAWAFYQYYQENKPVTVVCNDTGCSAYW